MTNLILKKVAKALKAANDECHAVVKYNIHSTTWEIWIDGKPVIVNFKDFDKAEDRCEELNYEYAARKAIVAYVTEVLSNRDFIKSIQKSQNGLHI